MRLGRTPGTGYTLNNYIDFVAGFVDERGLAPVSLVGNCMGSAMSLGFAMQRPDDVHRLVLLNPLTEKTFLAGWMGPLLQMRKHMPGFSRRLYSNLGRIRLNQTIGSQALRFQTGPHGKTLKVHAIPELCDCYASSGQLESLLGALDDLENFSYLDKFQPGSNFSPICTIWGQDNRVLSPRAGKQLNSMLCPQRQEWLEGCGHLPMLEQPGRVADIINDFLQ